MNNITQEFIQSINILIEFRANIDNLVCNFPESVNDIEIIESYIDYEIKKTLKDIIHIERL